MRRGPVVLVLGLCGIIAWYATRGESQTTPKSPADCKYGLEPGGGPMRCADPSDANSFYGMQRSLFAFIQFPIPGEKATDAVCFLMRPQQFIANQEQSFSIPPEMSPGYPVLAPYYAHWNFIIHAAKREIEVVEIIDSQGNMKKVNLTAKLHEVPQHDWPCKLHTWAALMSNQQIDPGQVPDRRYGIAVK